jgi:hypothetical protein
MSQDTDFNPDEFDKDEPADYRCMGSVECKVCRKHHGYCAEVAEDKEKQMLPTGDNQETKGRSRRSGGSNMEYLKNEDLSKNPKEARILAVKLDPENKFGSRIIIKLSLEGAVKFWGVPTSKSKSPNYRLLLEKFGPDENDWPDKKILLLLEQDEFSGNWYPRVDFPAEEKKRK